MGICVERLWLLYCLGYSSQVTCHLALVYYRCSGSEQHGFKYHSFPTWPLTFLRENSIVYAYFGSSYSACNVSMYPLLTFNKWLMDLYNVVRREDHLIRYWVRSPLKYVDLITPYRNKKTEAMKTSGVLSMTHCLVGGRESTSLPGLLFIFFT